MQAFISLTTGCSIPVVRTIRVRVDWVRFPAARKNEVIEAEAGQLLGLRWESKPTAMFPPAGWNREGRLETMPSDGEACVERVPSRPLENIVSCKRRAVV